MSRFLLAFSLLLTLTLAPLAHADRQNIDWSSDWKFLDSDAEPTADTSAWSPIQVPHTWDVEKYRRGAGWYAKTFNAPAAWKGKRVFVYFEAVSLAADVYLNGEKLDRHEGGFTAFCIELTSHLKFNGPNELRVRADNSRLGIPPDSADFNFNGGIYRPVHLIVADPVMISPLDHASPGVYITSKQITPQSASIEVKTLVVNGSPANANSNLSVEIYDANNKRVARSQIKSSVVAGQTAHIIQTLTVANPHLWNALKDPYLYQVRVSLSGKAGSDEIDQPLGIRTVGFNSDERFVLNGAPYPIHGVNRHQDWKGKAWAISAEDQKTDFDLIKEIGATAVRLAHYPQSHVFLDLADKNGILMWQEIPVVNRVLDGEKFSANAKEQLTEMVLQYYNHPSIMVWGLFNEVHHPAGTTPPEKLIAEESALAHSLDSTRPTVAASDSPNLTPMNLAPDHIGFNMYPGWYSGQPGDFTKIVEDDSGKVNGHRIAISEYGAGASVIQHMEGELTKTNPGSKFHPEEWQTWVHQQGWQQLKDNPHVWGTFVWSMFDFAVDGRNEGDRPKINDKGLVTDDRKTRKDAFYFYKANWNPEPMIYIASRRMTPRKLATTQVKVFSNAAEVELLVNGKSLGTAKSDTVNVFRWENVQLAPGQNHVEARATVGGQVLSDSCDWELQAP